MSDQEHLCSHCGQKMNKWKAPEDSDWGGVLKYVCFNNDCPYLIGGWDVMAAQGTPGFSYRLMYNPDLDRCMPTPLPSGYAERTTEGNPRG